MWQHEVYEKWSESGYILKGEPTWLVNDGMWEKKMESSMTISSLPWAHVRTGPSHGDMGKPVERAGFEVKKKSGLQILLIELLF